MTIFKNLNLEYIFENDFDNIWYGELNHKLNQNISIQDIEDFLKEIKSNYYYFMLWLDLNGLIKDSAVDSGDISIHLINDAFININTSKSVVEYYTN